MKHGIPALLMAVAALAPAHGQSFSNLDFEAATVVPSDPTFGFLNWNLAVPGWNHSTGADTGSVYYGSTHAGLTQWYLLVDSATQPNSALAGRYSMRFSSGYETSNPSTPWVNAYLSQTGTIPTGTRSLSLLATGPIGVSINGTMAPLLSMSASSFAVDVSAYAGSVAEIRFVNTSRQLFDPVTLDNIRFSVAAVPEPASGILLCLGAAVISFTRRPRKERCAGSASMAVAFSA